MTHLSPSTLADAALATVGHTMAITQKPQEKHWQPEDCTVLEDGRYRLVTSNVLLAEDVKSDLVPQGSGIVMDSLRSDRWTEFCQEHGGLPSSHAAVGNVFRDGLLSMERGFTKITEKVSDRSLPDVKNAYRLADTLLMLSYTLDTRDPVAVKEFEAKLLGIVMLFDTKGDELKEAVRAYVREITLDDALGRQNKERWALMFMKAKRLMEEVLRKLSRWESQAENRRDAVTNLIEALLIQADGFRVIALQAANSRALLEDEGLVENKDNAVLAWRQYRDALKGAIALPFRPWFRLAGEHFDRAITALSLSDMSGLKDTKRALLAADACLRVPRIMHTVNAVTLPVSRAREFNTREAFLDLSRDRTMLAATLTEAGGELVDIEGVLEMPELRSSTEYSPIRKCIVHLAEAEETLSPFSDKRHFFEDAVSDIYTHLVQANRALMGV